MRWLVDKVYQDQVVRARNIAIRNRLQHGGIADGSLVGVPEEPKMIADDEAEIYAAHEGRRPNAYARPSLRKM